MENIPFRIGHGYDVHRLVEGRKLIMGGVEIPYEKGLLGHSDADVLLHAVSDALLGALALGRHRQALSGHRSCLCRSRQLKAAGTGGGKGEGTGYAVGNLDATILCQKPKLAPYIVPMREKIAAACGVSVEQVSVKATTEEKLGFTGEGLGISAHCVCLLVKA